MRPFCKVVCTSLLGAATIFACQTYEVGRPDEASFDREAYENVEPGMSPVEVRQILGEPKDSVVQGDDIVWMAYGTTDVELLIYFQEGEVATKPSYPRAGLRR